MEKFSRIKGHAAPLMQINIDTDQMIPSRFLPRAHVPGVLKEGLFAEWKTRADGTPNPDFILNREPWGQAPILVAGRNFGCGSSREGAPKALRQWGFRAIVAASFGDIFYGNCFRNGIAPVVLPEATVEAMARDAMERGADALIEVDLEANTVTTARGEVLPFQSPARLRAMLLGGLDEIDLTLTMRQDIDGFRSRDRSVRPWAYALPGPA
ncbi:3-isopropylmalate dehydratase small subunit [Bordetella bronchialis]|uniref:3-isopropylmalate dehydratase small subunit n=1 Tax=Bordetella bronchialis TaxID=463025 RepID=UPI003D04466D